MGRSGGTPLFVQFQKVAAPYVQNFDDAVAISSANEVEQLCTGLSRKIWQKIMILDQTLADATGAQAGSMTNGQ